MSFRFIVILGIVFYFLTLGSIIWNFLKSDKSLTTKSEMNHKQIQKIVLKFAIIFGVFVIVIILLLHLIISPFINKLITLLWKASENFSPYFVMIFLFLLLSVLFILFVTLNIKRRKKGEKPSWFTIFFIVILPLSIIGYFIIKIILLPDICSFKKKILLIIPMLFISILIVLRGLLLSFSSEWNKRISSHIVDRNDKKSYT